MNRTAHARSHGESTSRPYLCWLDARVLAAAFLIGLFLILTVPLVLKTTLDIYDERDESNFHYPTVRAFVDQFPNLDLVNYDSATTPLYHVVLALSSFVLGSDISHLRFLNLTFSLLCLLVFYRYLSRRGNLVKASYFTILLMLSPYFIGPAIRISTDNVALLFGLLAIYVMDVAYPCNRIYLLSSILILSANLKRQLYAWLIGAYELIYFLRWRFGRQVANPVAAFAPMLIPISGLAFFLLLWKGLVPPGSAIHTSQGLNWDALVYILSLIGLYGSFCGFWLFEMFAENQGRMLHVVALVGIAFVALLVHPVSNEYWTVNDSLTNRGGALWLAASALPNFLSSAIVFWALFPIGLVCSYVLLRFLVARREYLMVICFLLWAAANLANYATYQKYYEPFIMFLLGYAIVATKIEEKWYHWIGPAVLLIGFMGVAFTRFR